MNKGTFATSISCMDGRIQEPISKWIKDKYPIDFVDTITEPGVNAMISRRQNLDQLTKKVNISVNAHKSKLIVVSGHYDCAGNPIGEKEQIDQIKDGVTIIKSWEYRDVMVVGVWVDSNWSVLEVDTRG